MILKKVIAGAQSGVDRAAFDAATRVGLPVDCYCTKGLPAGNGIPLTCSLHELETTEHQIRVENNVVISDGTLIINKGALTRGTKLSYDFAVKHLMPCLIVQLDAEEIMAETKVVTWIRRRQIKTLNIAGPRETKYPEGIYSEAYRYLESLFTMLSSAAGGGDQRRG